jgi:cyclophilin family peptidyl-prolyl cis-trans isomerase
MNPPRPFPHCSTWRLRREIALVLNTQNHDDGPVLGNNLARPAKHAENGGQLAPNPLPQIAVSTHGGVAVKSSRKPAFALLVIIPVLAYTGCQKSGDSAPATTAVSGPSGNKAEAAANPVADPDEAKPDPELQHPVFAIDTTAGKITVRLDAEKAPLTVDNFRNYVHNGRYDQTIFHQVFSTPVQVVLGGMYKADLKEMQHYTPIRNEADNGLKNRRGTIAMARRADNEDSATSQFFFNIADNNSLNYKAGITRSGTDAQEADAVRAQRYGYCVFGEVTEGMDVLDRIAKSPVHDAGGHEHMPVESIAIRSVRQIK